MIPFNNKVLRDDPYWTSRISLMPFEGVNGATSFVDLAGNTLFNIGSPVLTTAQKPYGLSSLDCRNGGVGFTPKASQQLLGNDFAAELWFYPTGTTNCLLIGQAPRVTGWGWMISLNGTNLYFNMSYATTGDVLNAANIAPSAYTLNAWNRLIVGKASNSIYAWVNNFGGTTTMIANRPYCAKYDTSTPISVGCAADGSGKFQGYVKDVRLTLGINPYGVAQPPSTTNSLKLLPQPTGALMASSGGNTVVGNGVARQGVVAKQQAIYWG